MKKQVRYNDRIANEIVRAISTSAKGIKRLCKENSHWPSHVAIYNWCFENEEFLSRYARAKAFQAEWLVEEALEIAYDGSGDTYIDEKGNQRLDNEWVQRSRLKVDTIKWVASKLAPKLYGTSNIKQNEQDQESLIEKVIDKL
jgi:hypothetical protein